MSPGETLEKIMPSITERAIATAWDLYDAGSPRKASEAFTLAVKACGSYEDYVACKNHLAAFTANLRDDLRGIE